MIKLFLITLLCVAVFADSQADSPVDKLNQAWTGPLNAMADMADGVANAMTGQASSLVRRAAEGPGQRQGPPQQGPPSPPGGGQGQNQN